MKQTSTGRIQSILDPFFLFLMVIGYQCFEKYLAEPEAVSVSHQFVGELPFPSLTFCPISMNDPLKRFPKTVNIPIFQQCKITRLRYSY